MKFSAFAVAAAMAVPAVSGAGSCKSVGSNCASLGLLGELTCTSMNAIGGYGCTWDATNSVCAGPSPPTDCGANKDVAACTAANGLGCMWDLHGQCDGYDINLCSNANSEYYKCNLDLTTSWVDDIWADFSSAFSADVMGKYQDKAICGCLPKYFNCLFTTDCGNPTNRALFETTCQATVTAMSGFAGDDSSCEATWCDSVGVTTDESIWDIVFDFATDAGDWTAEKLASFKAAIEIEIGGSIDLDWIQFDAGTNKVTITIPEGIVISKDEMLAMIETLKNLATQPVMKETFGTQSVDVTTKQTASVDENQWPPGSGSTRILSGVAAVVALGVVLESFSFGF